MFVTTIINLVLSSVDIGTMLIVAIRKPLIPGIDYSLSEQPELVTSGLRKAILVTLWAATLPVSIKLSPPHPVSIYARWRYVSTTSFLSGGLGPSSQIDSG